MTNPFSFGQDGDKVTLLCEGREINRGVGGPVKAQQETLKLWLIIRAEKLAA